MNNLITRRPKLLIHERNGRETNVVIEFCKIEMLTVKAVYGFLVSLTLKQATFMLLEFAIIFFLFTSLIQTDRKKTINSVYSSKSPFSQATKWREAHRWARAHNSIYYIHRHSTNYFRFSFHLFAEEKENGIFFFISNWIWSQFPAAHFEIALKAKRNE